MKLILAKDILTCTQDKSSHSLPPCSLHSQHRNYGNIVEYTVPGTAQNKCYTGGDSIWLSQIPQVVLLAGERSQTSPAN